jgi:cytidylate kinase
MKQKPNVFEKYLYHKYYETDMPVKKGGPVITISREFGCRASDLAEKIVTKISRNENDEKKWYIINKEIFSKSVEELHTNPERIEHIFEGKFKSALNSLSESFLKTIYLPDSKIIKTIKNVIKSYAFTGNIIIVGRASCVIVSEFPHSLNLKLYAPIDYRIQKISKIFNITKKEALDEINKMDIKRNSFMKFFTGNRNETDYYDVMINCAKYDEPELIDMIINLAKERGLI